MQRLVLLLTAIVLVGIAGFAAVYFGAGRDLQGPAVAFLMHCRDADFEGARAETHPRFQEARSVEQLGALWGHWEESHGGFREVVRRIGVQYPREDQTWAECLTLDVGFKRGNVAGRFYYQDDSQGVRRLVHVALERQRLVDVPATDRSRLEATARKLFGFLDAGAVLPFYDALGADLQMSWQQAKIEADVSAWRARLGALQDVSLASTRDDGARVIQLYEVDFAQGKAAFEVTHRHDEGAWSVVGFRAR